MSSELYRLEELLEITSSKRIHMADYVQSGVPFYRGKEVIERSKGNAVSTSLFITHKKYSDIKTKFGSPLNGDILLTSVGTLGVPYIVCDDGEFYFKDGNVTWFRNFDAKINSRYLYYWLTSPATQQRLDQVSIGSTQKALTIVALKSLEIALPELPVQLATVDILDSLSERITLLRETNATLEAIAQALFKSWFVDFDPVRAKQEGRIPEGMDEETAGLFPDSFEESELGMIPKGWGVLPLDEIANYLNGLALQKFPPTGIDDLPVIKIAQLRKGDSTGGDLASRSIKPEYVVRDGDILFSWSGTLMVSIWCGGEGALNQHLFKVSSEIFPKWFYYHWTLQHLSNFQAIAESKATTMGHIQRSHLSAAKVVIPDAEVFSKAGRLLEALLAKRIENQVQAKALASLRDALLPRLISGQLRLGDSVVTE
jgi:type I restriction enzyme S subunit